MSNRRHQERLIGILARLLGEDRLLGERAVPRARRYIDAVVTVRGPVDGLRPLWPLIMDRSMVVEHLHRRPRVPDWARAAAKLGHLVDEHWQKQQKQPGSAAGLRRTVGEAAAWSGLTHEWLEATAHGCELDVPHSPVCGSRATREAASIGARDQSSDPAAPAGRPPLLLLVASSSLGSDLACQIEVPETPVQGIRFLARPLLGDLLVIELHRLPKGRPGYSVLRLMPTPGSEENAREGIRELLADPAVLESTKEALMTDLASNRIPSTEEEHRSILDIARDEGRAEVRREAEAHVAREVKARRNAERRIADAETRSAREAEARKEAEARSTLEAEARKEAEARIQALEEEIAALRASKE